eukprot:g32785.t1
MRSNHRSICDKEPVIQDEGRGMSKDLLQLLPPDSSQRGYCSSRSTKSSEWHSRGREGAMQSVPSTVPSTPKAVGRCLVSHQGTPCATPARSRNRDACGTPVRSRDTSQETKRVAVSAGGDHALISIPEPRPATYALGDNRYGQLGQGHDQAISHRVKIEVGPRIEETGRRGQLGNGGVESQWSPLVMPLPEKALAASAGCWFSLLLMQSGEVYGTGHNSLGQLGVGDDWRLTKPQKMQLPGKAKGIAAGCSHSLVLLESGEEDQKFPQKMHLNGTARAIAAGTSHSLILMDSGEVLSVGSNIHGQLGLGHNEQILTPKPMPLDARAVAVAAGDLHSLVVTEDGRCFGAGGNSDGQLGEHNMPVRMKITERVLDVAAGWSYSLMVSDNGIFTAGYSLLHNVAHMDGAHPLSFEEPPVLL